MSALVKRRVEVYVWEPVVRWCHWMIVVCIFVLAITGYLIGNPLPLTNGKEFTMDRLRFIHSVTALVFTAAVLLRLVWLFMRNQYANWRGLIPVSHQRRKNAFETLKFYLFLRLKSPGSVGHNALAGMAYAAVYILCMIEIVTGYALYTMSSTEGIGWIIRVFGAQEVRFVHHLLTWVFLMFFVHHVYSVFLCSMSERDGLVEAMLDGYKFIEEEKLEAREGQ